MNCAACGRGITEDEEWHSLRGLTYCELCWAKAGQLSPVTEDIEQEEELR